MIARIGYFDSTDLTDRTWVPDALNGQPGLRSWFHLVDDESGQHISLTIWDDLDAATTGEAAVAAAARNVNFTGPGPDRVQRLRIVRTLTNP